MTQKNADNLLSVYQNVLGSIFALLWLGQWGLLILFADFAWFETTQEDGPGGFGLYVGMVVSVAALSFATHFFGRFWAQCHVFPYWPEIASGGLQIFIFLPSLLFCATILPFLFNGWLVFVAFLAFAGHEIFWRGAGDQWGERLARRFCSLIVTSTWTEIGGNIWKETASFFKRLCSAFRSPQRFFQRCKAILKLKERSNRSLLVCNPMKRDVYFENNLDIQKEPVLEETQTATIQATSVQTKLSQTKTAYWPTVPIRGGKDCWDDTQNAGERDANSAREDGAREDNAWENNLFESGLPENDANTIQTQTRSLLENGVEQLEGWIRVFFQSKEQTTTVHLAFCPPFRSLPVMELEQLSGKMVECRVTQLQPFGARIEIKRELETEEKNASNSSQNAETESERLTEKLTGTLTGTSTEGVLPDVAQSFSSTEWGGACAAHQNSEGKAEPVEPIRLGFFVKTNF